MIFSYGWLVKSSVWDIVTIYPSHKHDLSTHPYDRYMLLWHTDDSVSHPYDIISAYRVYTNELLSHPYDIGILLSWNMDRLVSHPYETAVLMSYGWLTNSPVCRGIGIVSHTNELLNHPYEITCGWTNMSWPFYATCDSVLRRSKSVNLTYPDKLSPHQANKTTKCGMLWAIGV